MIMNVKVRYAEINLDFVGALTATHWRPMICSMTVLMDISVLHQEHMLINGTLVYPKDQLASVVPRIFNVCPSPVIRTPIYANVIPMTGAPALMVVAVFVTIMERIVPVVNYSLEKNAILTVNVSTVNAIAMGLVLVSIKTNVGL